MAESPRQSLEQKRAKLAWSQVEKIEGKSGTYQKQYRARARGLPAMIMTSGLGQTLAFLLSKNEPGQREPNADGAVALHLAEWLLSKDSPLPWPKAGGRGQPEALLCLIQERSSIEYRQAAREALEFATWLKRFASARLQGD